MYQIKCKLPENRKPWELTLSIRCSILRQALVQGKRVALLLYEQPDTSTFRYRGYNIMQSTYSSDKWQSVYFFLHEIDVITEMMPSIHLLVIIRVRWTHQIDRIIAHARQNHIRILFDIDDMVYNLEKLNLVTNTLNVGFHQTADYDFWFAYIGRIGYTASLVDGFITTNDYLGTQLHHYYGKPWQIICNSLNEEQMIVSEQCVHAKSLQPWRGPFTIGYFSGTPSHINDFREIYMEIISLLNAYPQIRLKVVGFMEFPKEMKIFLDRGQVQLVPLVDFLELQTLIAGVDINIVPLVDNTFTNCKSELKYFESAVVNTITLATPTYTFARCIENGKNGFLCRPGNWYRTIEQIYLEKVNTEEIIDNARKDAIEKYSGKAVVSQIERCYDYFMN